MADTALTAATGSPLASDITLRITEIFFSLQGESSWAGLPTVFVRLTGCPLRCSYCDTAYAFHGGESLSITDVMTRVAAFGADYICVTGGEPLAQKSCLHLLTRLCDTGYQVSIETSGAMDIAEVDPRVKRIVDLKTPASAEVAKNRYENIALLKASDELKFVIGSREDYLWSLQMIEQFELDAKVGNILFSPAFAVADFKPSSGEFSPELLASWILQDKPPARMQMQLHKLIWGDEPGR